MRPIFVIITFSSLNKITFPVFALPSDNWYKQDSLVYVEGRLVDDRSVKSDSLGVRRLRSPFRENMLKVNKSYDTPVDVIFCKYHKHFIDSKGRIFTYEKTKYCTVRYFSIRRVEKLGHKSKILLHGCDETYLVKRPPDPDLKWAGVIFISRFPWELYELSTDKKEDARRKI